MRHGTRLLEPWTTELRVVSDVRVGERLADGVRICSAGYGATTLPSVTEALTIEGNATRAEEEASRVAALLGHLTETIKV